MKFSFFMMPIHHPTENPALAFQRDIEMIHLADALDFDEFMIGEHHSGGWETMPCPEMALAMAAAKAHRIRLGTSVVNLPFHHPFHVAERIAFLDHLTRGRAILGVGPSNLSTDKRLFNTPQDKLYPMMFEALEIIIKLLETADPFDHDGAFWSFRDLRLQLRSYQAPRLPIAIASSTGSPQILEMAGRHDMILMSGVGKNRPTNHADNWTIVERAAAKAGKTARRENWRIANYFYLAETREEAWADVSASIMRDAEYFSAIGLKMIYEAYPGQPYSEFTPRSCADRRDWVIGTPDDAIAWIEQKNRETGGIGGIMLTTHEWVEPVKMRRSIELFARYVMPHFRGHNATFQDEWRRIKAAQPSGGVAPADPARKFNLVSPGW
ncbi:MAG: LLM class flavin-dependent oxidoreductase [Alphaproteobacteria bacterium]|nr:LLM class flavin-dependent oxidoreductase [Alphaproteobacteria bacterium]